LNKDCVLVLEDEVNAKFNGLDIDMRRKLSNAVKYFVPHAKHTPAYKLGRWDGFERFCNIGGVTFVNLLDKLLPIVQSGGYNIVLDDKRTPYDFNFNEISKDTLSNKTWPQGHDMAGMPILFRDHQVAIVNEYLKNVQGIQSIPTGAGKTLICAMLSLSIEKYGRSIIIVPSKDLISQTEADYKNLGLDVGVFYGDRKDPNHKHVICTWQSIEALDKKSKKDDNGVGISSLVDDVICIICDEAHGTKAAVLSKHLCSTFKDVPIRWGMTGTIPLEDYESAQLLCSIGQVINTVSAKDLQDLGILSNLKINIIQINDFKNSFDSYHSELKYLVTDKHRVKFLSSILQPISDSGNTLILVDRVATGELLQELIPKSVFLSGTVASTSRKLEYSEMNDSDDKTIIATYGICAVGINVPRVYNLVLIEPGKSFIRVIQSIGRGLRVAKDKDFVSVYDISSTAKFSKKHLAKRKKFYDISQYPFETFKIDIPTDVDK
jgi:superfamily II DNA or RNA helicase